MAAPECLDQKFMVSKKEVQVQEKWVIGSSVLSRQKTQKTPDNKHKITPKLMLEQCYEESKEQ